MEGGPWMSGRSPRLRAAGLSAKLCGLSLPSLSPGNWEAPLPTQGSRGQDPGGQAGRAGRAG